MNNEQLNSRNCYKCQMFGDTFKLSVSYEYDSAEFVRRLMTSKKIDWLFQSDDTQDWCDDSFFLNVCNKELNFQKGKTKDEYFMWFVGFLYKYAMIMYKMSKAEVYKKLSFVKLEKGFEFYHTQDWDYVINDLINAK